MPKNSRSPFEDTPWHQTSFDRFIQQTLPQLLGSHFELAAYRPLEQDTYTFSLQLAVNSPQGRVDLAYSDLPRPDADGLFCLEGHYRVVVPYPSEHRLDTAEIFCVGEQLHRFFAQRLSDPPQGLEWDAETLRAWLPLDRWMLDFHTEPTSQYLQTGNWLDRVVHRRRLSLVPICPNPLEPEEVFPLENLGLVCPFNTPEGPNIGRLLEIAGGATIRDGRLVRLDASPAAALGVAAALVPLLPHDDSNRALMGMKTMRQWATAANPEAPMQPDGPFRIEYERARASNGRPPEPALVQTGNEPEAADFWGGYNLLTAFIMWDDDTFEDGIVLSQSGADRLDFPQALTVGDRLSNRHGAQGTVSRILPDKQMPQMPDGTPVDLIYSPTSMISRLNFGQVREAVLGRLAYAQGKPVVLPSLETLPTDELQRRLARADLPTDGMEKLSLEDRDLPHRSTVGWVYWGRLGQGQGARQRLDAVQDPRGNRSVGVLAYRALLANHAFASIHEYFNTCSAERPGAAGLEAELESGSLEPAPPPTPRYTRLKSFLSLTGIRLERQAESLRFSFAEPGQVPLAEAIEHPWAAGHQLSSIGDFSILPDCRQRPHLAQQYEAVLDANNNLKRLLQNQAPTPLLQPARQRLQRLLAVFFEALLLPENLRFHTRVLFSGGAAAAPGPELGWEEVGLPDELAWSLFGPQVKHAIGEGSLETDAAAQALDTIMAQSWVVLYSGQEIMEDTAHGLAYHMPATALIACRPRRHPEPVIRLHPRLSGLMEVDFDGDPLSVFLPLTREAQHEAGQLLSLRGHLRRDREVLVHLADNYHGMLWGLSRLYDTKAGRTQIHAVLGKDTSWDTFGKKRLNQRLYQIFQDQGIDPVIEALESLRRLGCQACKESGASFNPFLGQDCAWPTPPADDDPDLWELYFDEVLAALYQTADPNDDDLGPLVRLNRSGARGNAHQLRLFVGAHGPQREIGGKGATVRHSLCQGRSADEVLWQAPRALWGLAAASRQWTQAVDKSAAAWMRNTGTETDDASTFGVLGRAFRARRPGLVFARAAAAGDIDPLESVPSRLFVGLPAI
jgi:hypothetical protein